MSCNTIGNEKLEVVRQKKSTSCGVAVVAMLAGVTHDEALEVMFGKGPYARSMKFGTDWDDLRRGLQFFNVKHERAYYIKHWRRLTKLAILGSGDEVDDLKGHWVIYDPKNGLIYDPCPTRGGEKPADRWKPPFNKPVYAYMAITDRPGSSKVRNGRVS